MFHVTKEPETVVTGEETTTTDLLWKKHLWNCRYICFSFTTAAKSLVSLSEFQPSGLITLRKSRRAWRLNYFIPIQVSSALNRKLAVRRCRTDKCTIQHPNINSHRKYSQFRRLWDELYLLGHFAPHIAKCKYIYTLWKYVPLFLPSTTSLEVFLLPLLPSKEISVNLEEILYHPPSVWYTVMWC